MKSTRWLALALGFVCVAGRVPSRGEMPQAPATSTNPVSLDECLKETLSKNPEIQKQRMDVERATGTKLVFTSRALPSASAQILAGERGGALYATVGEFIIGTGDFSQPLVDVGIPPALRRGRLEVAIAEQNLNLAVVEKLHAVRTAYLRALMNRDLLALRQKIEKRVQASVDNRQRALELGSATRKDVLQAEVQLLNLKPGLAFVRREYRTAVTQLGELLGRDPNKNSPAGTGLFLLTPDGDLQYTAVKLDLEKEAAWARAHRSDLQILRNLIKSAAEERRMIQAAYFPKVSLIVSGLYIPDAVLKSSVDVVPGRDQQASELRYGFGASWRVIDNGQVIGPSERAESIRQQYEITLQRLEENIARELAVVARALETSDAKIEALNKSIAAAEENLKLVEDKIALGEAAQLDFLNAQQNLLSAQEAILNATFQHEVAIAELDRITGRYFELRPDPKR